MICVHLNRGGSRQGGPLGPVRSKDLSIPKVVVFHGCDRIYMYFHGFHTSAYVFPVRFAQYRTSPQQQQQQQLMLKPLFFEVPQQESDPLFLGRDWLVQDINNALMHSNSSGVVVTGLPGTGKTAFVLQLVEHSCFGRLKSNRKYLAAYSSNSFFSFSFSLFFFHACF